MQVPGLRTRVIGCIVIKSGMVVQSIGFNRYLPIGQPGIAVEFLSKWDIDEIIILDIDATREHRLLDTGMLSEVTRDCYVPVTAGGGINSVNDVYQLIRNGADKVSINSACAFNPEFVSEASSAFGAQCIVGSADARLIDGKYQVVTDSGQVSTGKEPVEWAKHLEDLGVGEILLNSVDRDGTKAGFDVELISSVSDSVGVPVVAIGGAGDAGDFSEAINSGGASAVAAANIFHFTEHASVLAKVQMKRDKVNVRLESVAQYRQQPFSQDCRLNKNSKLDTERLVFRRYEVENI